MRDKKVLFLVQAAAIAAIYVVLTVAFAPLSFGEVQVRFAEGLTVLPYFTPAAIPGLFAGCLIGNFFGGAIPVDILCGSLATLAGAVISRLLRKHKFLVPPSAHYRQYPGGALRALLRIRRKSSHPIPDADGGDRRGTFLRRHRHHSAAGPWSVTEEPSSGRTAPFPHSRIPRPRYGHTFSDQKYRRYRTRMLFHHGIHGGAASSFIKAKHQS